jgi:hypothetical protein
MIGTLAILLLFQRPGTAEHRSGGNLRISDLSAMRISPVHTEALPVYRVVVDGEAVSLGQGGVPAIRVDLDIDDKHITVWIREP